MRTRLRDTNSYSVSSLFFIIVGLSILLRLLWLYGIHHYNTHSGFITYDSKGYFLLAENIISNSEFARYYFGTVYPEFFRTPAYPYFLSLFIRIGLTEYGIIIFQIILASLTCGITALLAFQVTKSKKAAFIAGLLLVFDIPSLLVSQLFLSETLFTFLFILGFYVFVRYIQASKESRFNTMLCFISALLLCVATLTRPVGQYALLIILLYLIVFKQTRNQAMLFLLAFSLILLPWMIRNKNATGHFMISSAGTEVFSFYPVASVLSKANGVTLKDARMQVDNFINEKVERTKCSRVLAERELNYQTLLKYPFHFVLEYSKGVLYFFLKPAKDLFDQQFGTQGRLQNTDTLRDSEKIKDTTKSTSLLAIVLSILQVVILVFLYPGFIAGIIYSSGTPWFRPFILILILVVLFSLSIPGSYSDCRFRIPVMPLIICIAVFGWSRIFESEKFRAFRN